MKKFLKLIACYPLEFIILMFMIPLSIKRPSFVLSSFFFITSILLLGALIKTKKRPRHLSLGLIFAFFIIYIGLILFLELPWLWFAPLIISLINISLIKKLIKINKIDPYLVVDSLKFAFLLVGLVPLLLIFFQFLHQKKETTKLTNRAKVVMSENIDSKALEKSLKNISAEPILKELIQSGNSSQSLPVLSALMHANNLSYLTVTDKAGFVRLRAHKPEAIGDNMFLSNPEIKPIFEGNEMEGFLKIQELPIAYIKGYAVTDESNTTIGAIFGGYLLNDNLARNIVKDNFTGAIFATENETFGYYSKDPALNSFLIAIGNDKNIKPFYDKVGREDYLFLPLKIINSSGKNIGHIIFASQSERQKNLSNILFISLTTIILIAGALKNGTKKLK
jgi:hypothetical protein